MQSNKYENGKEGFWLDTKEWVAAAKAGKEEAFLALLETRKERLFRIAIGYLHNETDALDAVQETVCRAFQNLKKLKQPEYFDTWLVRILLNACADEYRRKRKMAYTGKESKGTGFEDTSDTRVSLRQAVDQLPPEQKEIIILKYYQQFTLSEVAALLECPEGTVKTRLHKALVKLRKTLGEEVTCFA
ncbi:sigma-70 family RNA polymerase sigma factor [Paenibacillus qinlingensis]|uniref:sigma-70 family RNA polymerase sigma factor n=1 Tax=Paenibacillus qinlingensis TaxID=1837343 RepID=UPI00286BF99A|nr:sigma-70 family RNA polymerase sigma factor [Paenibacillus qinlingensis]